MSKKVVVTLVKSTIGSTKRQISTIKGLGLRRLNSVSTLDHTPEVAGMISKVSHLVSVKEES